MYVYVKHTFIKTEHLKSLDGGRCFPPDFNGFEYDLEDVSPRVFAKAVSLAPLATQARQWGNLTNVCLNFSF